MPNFILKLKLYQHFGLISGIILEIWVDGPIWVDGQIWVDKFGLMGSPQISRGHKLAGGMGATEAPIWVQGQCPGVGARGAKPPPQPKTNLSISELKK